VPHIVVLDTNVLVSALLSPDSTPGQVVAAAFSLRFTLVTSERMLEELNLVLERPQLASRLQAEHVGVFLEAVRGVADLVEDPSDVPVVTRDRDDDYVVALAVASGADVIVSGDDDLLSATGVSVAIASPRHFLESLVANLPIAIRSLTHHDPDFSVAYGDKDAPISPRTAFVLWTAAVYLYDTWRTNADDPAFFDAMPMLARPFVRDANWLGRFIGCFAAVADRIATADFTPWAIATRTGEEMAFHLAVETAEAMVADEIATAAGEFEALPSSDHDLDFALVRELLLVDEDVLLLFDLRLDGISDPAGALSVDVRPALFHPSQWFIPFPE
jgi:uncharacterized protein